MLVDDANFCSNLVSWGGSRVAAVNSGIKLWQSEIYVLSYKVRILAKLISQLGPM